MPSPANLVFLMSDNHARGVLGCHGHPVVRTPNLDALAARGARFTDAYAASPLCCPARAALATGRYPHQTGYWDNAIVYDGRVPSWMRRVRDQGHRVAAVGKLHFRSSEDDNGFDEEHEVMHILGGRGGVSMLLRGFDDEPIAFGQRELYLEQTGEGEAPYQAYDRRITARAVAWLRERAGDDRPWILKVSYPSPHPPFRVPRRLLDLYPLDEVPLPPAFRPGERPAHPAIEHLRRQKRWPELTEHDARRIAAGYFALVTHLDEQIGEVLAAVDDLGLGETTRVLYTSDHGEMHGALGLLGKCNLYEPSIGVPLILAGPGIPPGRVVRELASHVDLFPTVTEGAGAALATEDADLPGESLWPAIEGADRERAAFAEYHAAGARSGGYMLREGRWKLVHHVGMPPQLFDLEADPDETRDLGADPAHAATVAALERRLRAICDPEAVDARAKADQRARVEALGGVDAVRSEGLLVYTPPPGGAPEIRAVAD